MQLFRNNFAIKTTGLQKQQPKSGYNVYTYKTPERDGRTDGQTDRFAVAITAVCIASNVDAL